MIFPEFKARMQIDQIAHFQTSPGVLVIGMKGVESNDQQNSSTDHRLHADDIQFKTRGNPVGAYFFFVSALEFSTFNGGSWFRDKNPIKLGLNRYRNVLCPCAFVPHPWMVTGCFYVPSFVYKLRLLYLTYPSVVSDISIVGSLDDRYLLR